MNLRPHALLLCLLLASGPLLADPPRVVVSIKPIHSLLAALMAGVEPPTLLWEGEEPPFGAPLSGEQQRRLGEADLLVWVGAELEQPLAESLAGLARPPATLELLGDPVLKVLPGPAGGRDPFFWLDSRNAILLVDELTALLMDRDPGHAHLYRRNRDELQQRLGLLDRQLEYGYRGLAGAPLLLYHDTQQYFAQAYALQVRDSLMAPTQSAPATETLLRAAADAAAGTYRCLLSEAWLPTPNLDLLSSAGLRHERLDSLGSRLAAGPDLYFQLMEHNTGVIRACIQGDRPVAVPPPPEEEGLPESVGSKFLLLDHRGEVFTEAAMLGHYALIYFGYTYCPDICPTSLQTVFLALDQLGPLAESVRPYFITIDPERDSVEVLRDYVGYFSPRLVGLTGSRKMIDRVAARYRVKYEKVIDGDTPPGQYLMDHSASVYLMAPDGRFLAKFAHGIPPERMAEELRGWLR
jgi:cytochrome oxidase Cu insertion factor (SCO1/SenC/PrrC family)/ABC-type Zn2+ transport system substrate-binding protein/surface adhesin